MSVFKLLFLLLLVSLSAIFTGANVHVHGGGQSLIFTGTTFGETQEVRTPVVSGFESFSISFWHRGVVTQANAGTADIFGYPGALWSFWRSTDGPSLGSGWAAKRRAGLDVYESIPMFSAYAYNSQRMHRVNIHTLSGGQIPTAGNRVNDRDWHHYVFTYSSLRKEIVKFENASSCAFEGLCDGRIENSSDVAADQSFLQNLPNDGIVPRGTFRLGQAEISEPTMAMEVDDFCVFNRSVSLYEAAQIEVEGCATVPGAQIHYAFNARRSQSPDLFNEISGEYTGTSRTFIDRDETILAECSADTGNMQSCEAAKVPFPNQGIFSKRIETDFGSDVGPYSANSGAPTSTTGPLNIIRASAANSSHIVRIQPSCIGECDRFVITSLPKQGTLCMQSPGANQPCPSEHMIDNGTIILLTENATFAESHHRRRAIPFFYLPATDSTSGARDEFTMTANNEGDTSTVYAQAKLVVRVITNTPVTLVADLADVLVEGKTKVLIVPTQQELVFEPDGNLQNLQVQILRAEYNQSLDNPARFYFYTSVSEESDWIPFEVPTSETPNTPPVLIDHPRLILILHADGTGVGNSVMDVVFRMYDQIEYGPEYRLTISVTALNKRPAILPLSLTFTEDTVPQMVDLGAQTSDRDGDMPLFRVIDLPKSGTLYQANENGTTGANVLLDVAGITVRQWTNGSLDQTASTCWEDWCVDKISGPPQMYPEAGDWYGTYSPGPEWITEDIFLELKVNDPIFLSELAFYFTWGPGAVVEIQTRPFDNFEAEWETVYEGPNTQSAFCTSQPISDPCAAINRYQLCPKPYASDSFRVRMNADLHERFLILDTVMATGSRQNDFSIISNPDGKLMWVPDPHFDGTDSFSVAVDDCAAFLVLQMPPLEREPTQVAIISANFTPVNDAPQYNEPKDRLSKILLAADGGNQEISLDISDIDNGLESVGITLVTLPKFGSLLLLDSEGLAIGITVGTTWTPYNTLLYRPGQCTAENMFDNEFDIELSDSAGAQSRWTVRSTVDCTRLPQRWKYELLSPLTVGFGVTCSIVGIILVVLAVIFNIGFRKVASVRVSGYRINLMLFMGCGFIYTALLGMSLDRPSSSCFTEGLSYGVIEFDVNISSQFSDNCPNLNCMGSISLLNIGATLAWGSLYAKTYRIKDLFFRSRNASAKSVKAMTDMDVAIIVAGLMCLTILGIIGFTVKIGPGALVLSQVSAELSTTSNEKLIEVGAQCFGGNMYNVFIYASTAFFVLLILMGAKMAVSVRGVHIKTVNESGQIAFATYTSVMLSIPGMAVAETVSDKQLSFVVLAFSIFLSTTVVLLAMWLPRLIYLRSVQVTTSGPTRGTHAPDLQMSTDCQPNIAQKGWFIKTGDSTPAASRSPKKARVVVSSWTSTANSDARSVISPNSTGA